MYESSLDIDPKIKFYQLTKELHEGSQVYCVWSNRSDVIEYFIRLLAKNNLKSRIFLLDEQSVLKGVYPRFEFKGSVYYELPLNRWSSKLYAQFKKLLKIESHKPETEEAIYVHDKPDLTLTPLQVNSHLIKHNYLYQADAPGCYVYGPSYVRLESLFSALYENIVLDQKPNRFKFSPLVSINDMIKMDYFFSCGDESHYHIKLKKPTRDLRIKSLLEGVVDPKALLEKTSGTHYMLNYCSCMGLWPSLRNHSFFNSEPYPIHFYDNSVATYRDQKGKITSLERLEVFNRFETVFLGDKETVLRGLDNYLVKLIKFFETCNIGFKVQKVPSWYMNDRGSDTGFTYDFITNIGKPLEIGNLSYNSNHWTKPFNVRYNNKPAESGCTGVGLQRLIYVFLINNGFDESKWPIYIQHILSSIDKGFKV